MNKIPDNLPQEPGEYLWYVSDWGYLDVGSVRVSCDPEKHLNYLEDQKRELLSKGEKPYFFVYQNKSGCQLTMYFNDISSRIFDSNGVPWADGYRSFNLDWLMEKEIKERENKNANYPKNSNE